MRPVSMLGAVLLLAAVAHGEDKLPAEIEGLPGDWTNLADAAIPTAAATKWKRDGAGVTATNPDAAWSVLELGAETHRDCAVRARVKTSAPCGIRVQAGKEVVATLIEEGTHLLRDGRAVASRPDVIMSGERKETDLVLVRRASRVEIWIDGARVLAGRDVPGDARPGIGIWQGTATFSEVRVRRFAAPGPLPGEDGKPIPSTHVKGGVELRLKGVYVHEGTRLSFPAKAGQMNRVGGTRYDEEANDVEVDYARVDLGGLLVASFYAYPAIRGADGKLVPFLEQFEGEAKEVRARANVVDGAVTESESFCSGRAVKVRTQEFEKDGEPPFQKVRMASWLTAFRMGPWHVTYRFTAPKAKRDEALAKFEALLTELAFPPTGIVSKPR